MLRGCRFCMLRVLSKPWHAGHQRVYIRQPQNPAKPYKRVLLAFIRALRGLEGVSHVYTNFYILGPKTQRSPQYVVHGLSFQLGCQVLGLSVLHAACRVLSQPSRGTPGAQTQTLEYGGLLVYSCFKYIGIGFRYIGVSIYMCIGPLRSPPNRIMVPDKSKRAL